MTSSMGKNSATVISFQGLLSLPLKNWSNYQKRDGTRYLDNRIENKSSNDFLVIKKMFLEPIFISFCGYSVSTQKLSRITKKKLWKSINLQNLHRIERKIIKLIKIVNKMFIPISR